MHLWIVIVATGIPMRLLLAWSCLVAALCAVPLASWAQLGQSDCSLARSEIDRDACYRANRENAQRNSTSRQRVEEATRRATPSPQEAERAEYWRKRTEEENTRRYEQDRAYKQSEAYKIQQALEKKAVMDRVWERRQLFAAVPALHRFNPPLRATVRSSNGYSAMGGDRVVQQWVRQLFPDTAEHIIEHASTDFLEQDRYKKCWTRDGTPGTVLALMPVGQDSRRAALFRYECQDTDLYVFESLSTDETASEALRIERQDYVALLTTAGVPAAQHFPPAPELTALQKLERRCHDDNDTAACARAAKAYAAGDGTGRNPNLAAQLLLQACRPPQPQGCGALAGALYMGDGLERSMKRARETAQGPCQDSRDPAACAVMGSLYLHGYQVDRDYTQALAHLQTACTGGDGLGCLGLGQMYEEGRGVVRDRGKARQAYDSGCKARISNACARLKGMQG